MHAKKNKKGDLNQLSIRQTIKLDTLNLNKHVQTLVMLATRTKM
jgi:hypothetical protein